MNPGPSNQECGEFFARLSEYLDGELPPDRSAEFEAHLQDCPPCIAFVQSLKRSIRLSREIAGAEPLPKPSSEQLAELRHAYEQSLRRRTSDR